MYKLIASDLDETLLDDHKQISTKSLDAIHKARELGIKFVPSTGRGFTLVQNVLRDLGLHDAAEEYVISFNGGMITENKQNKVIDFNGLPFDTIHTLFRLGIKKNVGIQVYTKTDVYIYRFNNDERNYLKNLTDSYIELKEPDISFLKDESLVKILFQNTNIPYLQTIRDEVLTFLDIPLSITYSSNRYLEFNQFGVDKGSALLKLANLLNIDRKEIIGIGDNHNDISLISSAGLGICVSNAAPDAKEHADYICQATNNESAIAEVIEKYVL